MEKAILDQDITTMASLIDSGGAELVNTLLKDGNTPLITTAQYGTKDMAELLLNKGAKIDATNALGATALQAAIVKDNTEIAKLLLDKGADPNIQDTEGVTALTYASYSGNIDIAKLLIDKGANINIQDNDGRTALMTSALSGMENITQLLLDNGADPNIKSNGVGNTALSIASITGHNNVAKILLDKGADGDVQDQSGNTALMQAVNNNNTELVEILLNKGVNINIKNQADDSPLVVASWKGSVDIVKLLLDKGAELNIKNQAGNSALIVASWKGFVDIVKLLLDKGAELNIKNQAGDSALIGATWKGFVDVVKLLLDKGADPNIRNRGQSTSLLFASSTGQTDIVKTLLSRDNVQLNAQNAQGSTALSNAARSGYTDIVKLLLEKGADASIKNNRGETAMDVAKNNEIRELIDRFVNPFTGKTKSDIEKYSVFVNAETEEQAIENAVKYTFCPVCLAMEKREGDCMYLIHTCKEEHRHKELFSKYQVANSIQWCSICGRICSENKHYGLALSNATPQLNGECGGVHEKLIRVVRMIDYAFELQHFVGEISESTAKKELVEETWNAPVLMRLRFDPLKFKKWKTDLSVFSGTLGTVSGGGQWRFSLIPDLDNSMCSIKKGGTKTRKIRKAKRNKH